MTTPLPSPRRTTDPDESTSPGALSASFDSPVSADWSTRQRSREEFHVRRDDVAGAHANDVAGDQLPGGNDLPARIAPDARTDLQPSPQCLDDTGGPALLHEAQHGVDHQQRAHHDEVRVFSEHGGQNHDQLEHPRRDSPEFPEELEDRVPFLLGHFVVAVLLPADVHLRASPCRLLSRERVGNRAEAMSEAGLPASGPSASDLLGSFAS